MHSCANFCKFVYLFIMLSLEEIAIIIMFVHVTHWVIQFKNIYFLRDSFVRGVCEGEGAGVWRILREICQILFFIFLLFLSAFFLWRCDVNKDLLKICRPTHIIHMFYLLGLNSFWLPTNKRKSWEKQQEISCTNICKSISNRYFSRDLFPSEDFQLAM